MRFTAVPILVFLILGACSPAKAPPIAGEHKLTQITKRVHVLHGPNELPNKINQGFMNNPSFVLTKKGVVIIDPGSSVQVGELVLKKIAEVTKDPVIAVFNTHIHGDHWLGNQAIKAAYPKAVIYAHSKMKAKTGTDGTGWITLFENMTDGAVRGTRPVAPDTHVEHEETLALNGTHFRVYHNDKAHTDGDIMIEVVEEKVMFLGDNALVDRIGRMDDGDFKGNTAALEMALATSAQHFVPGHGPANGRAVATDYRDYLKALRAEVKKYYDQGMTDFDMKPKVAAALVRFKAWKDFDDQLGKHISLAYLQVEADAF